MSDFKILLQRFKKIEAILEERFGGTGRGMHEKMTSIEYLIPDHLVRRIRYIASVRNKSVHVDGYEIDDESKLLSTCDAVIEALLQVPLPEGHRVGPQEDAGALAPPVAPREWPPEKRQSTASLVASFALGSCVLLYMLYQFVHLSTARPPAAAPQVSMNAAPAPAPQVQAPVRAAPQPKAPRKEREAPAKPARTEPAAQDRRDATQPPAVAAQQDSGDSGDSEQLTLRNPKIEFRDSWGRKEPMIRVTVTNNTNSTVSSAILGAKLFINGESAPVLTTGSLYAGFDQTGLLAGQTRTVSIYVSGFDSDLWNVPDVLNAHSRILQLGVLKFTDGRNREQTVAKNLSAAAWR